MDRNCRVFAVALELLLNAIRPLVGTAKRGTVVGSRWDMLQLLDSFWAILKGYWKAAGNAQKTQVPAGQ